MENGDKSESIRQNLLDAGCDASLMTEFVNLIQEGKIYHNLTHTCHN